MPELPDLQVFSRNLIKLFKGKTLSTVKVFAHKKLNVPAKELQEALEGAKLQEVVRDGKELFFHFDNKNILSLHLMLHGEIRLLQDDSKEKTKVIELVFNDGSGFTVTDYMKQATPRLNPPAQKGMDALSAELTPAFLKKKMVASKKAGIKTFLMDQKKIKGIGNAYADEILWEAKISPFSLCGEIPDEKAADLSKAIKSVLKDAEKQILKEHPDLITGEVRDFLKIHNHRVDESPNGKPIKTAEINGRKTYYTDEQKLYK
ncbi:DNA-formamidopyrimidine glycosylase [soil metagenome]